MSRRFRKSKAARSFLRGDIGRKTGQTGGLLSGSTKARQEHTWYTRDFRKASVRMGEEQRWEVGIVELSKSQRTYLKCSALLAI